MLRLTFPKLRIRSWAYAALLIGSLLTIAAYRLANVFTASAHDGGHVGEGGNGQPGNRALHEMGLTPCVGGMAFTFPCRNIDLASFLPLDHIGGGQANDVWGWTDPLTGKEYALLGRTTGTSFIDLSDPEHPVYLGNLPAHNISSTWRGIKVYKNHAFIISEAVDHGMQVFDLTQLRNVASPPVTFSETTHYGGFGRGHTIAINEETGFIYVAGSRDTCDGGLHMVNVQNPINPVFAGCVAQDGYTHETQCVTYRGPDAAYRGHEICFSSNVDTLTIVDVTNKSNPVQLSRTGYAGVGYTHQGWLTENQAHFLLDDELDELDAHNHTRTFIWNVSDLNAPNMIGTHDAETHSIDHNQYVRGRYVYQGNYQAGLRILDVNNIAAATMNEVAYFDVYPTEDEAAFNGAWSNYPFFASGLVLVGGIEQGLFVLRPTIPTAAQANLSISLAAPAGPLKVGNTLTYNVGAHNDGLATATAVKITDVLPPGVMLVSASASQGSCSGTTTVTCALGNLASGASATATINVKLTGSGTITNTVSVKATQGDPSLVNNSAQASTKVNPQLVSVTVNPSTVTGGKTVTGTITLSGPAPAPGAVVQLGSSNTTVATVPLRITVPQGAVSKTFSIATKAVASSVTVSISSAYDGVTKTTPLTVTPPSITSLLLTPATITGGCSTSTGKVTLDGKAPPGGAKVTLTDTNPAATVPASVTVAAGATTATFVITATSQSVEQTGQVTASYNGTSRNATLKVRPVGVLSLTLSPNPVVGPGDVTGTVNLECAAPAGGINVALSTSSAAIASPTVSSILIPAGSSSKTFTVRASDVPASRNVLIKATANGTSKSVILKVN
ncbi:MAG: choice-of-anchor B family protein [Pyrinomonadaceae bacterium]